MKKQINETLRKANEESHKLTRECICTALIYLMAQTPFDKITTTAIINRSGVSRAAFYRNYQSKNDVLKDIVSQLWEELNAALSNPEFKQNPKAWIARAFQNVADDSLTIEVLTKGLLPIESFFDEAKLLTLAESMTSAEYYYRMGILHAMWGILVEWCRRGMKETPEQMADILMATILLRSFEEG